MRYGAQLTINNGSPEIEAGVVRRAGDGEVFITHNPVTDQALTAAAVWLIMHGCSHRLTDHNGYTYELTARIIK